MPNQVSFEQEYTRLKDDIHLRLKGTQEFELAAVGSLGIVLTLGNVFGDGAYFYFANLASAAVVFACARAVNFHINTVYSAHAYIRAKSELGFSPADFRWDDHWATVLDPSKRKRLRLVLNHHSSFFLALTVVNILALVMGIVAHDEQRIEGYVALISSFFPLWPISRLEYFYRSQKDKLLPHWKAVLAQPRSQPK